MSNKVDPTIDYVLAKREDDAKLVFKYVYPNHPEKAAGEPTRQWEHSCRLQDLGWTWEGGTWLPPADRKPDAEAVRVKRDVLLSKRELAAQDVYHKNNLKFPLPSVRYRYTEALRENGWRYNGEWIAPGMDTKVEGPAPATEDEFMEDRAKLAFHAAGMAWTDVFGPLVVRNKCAYSDYLASIGWTYNVYRGEWLPPDGDVKPAAAEQVTQQDEPEATRCAAIRALVNLGFSRADAEARISKEQTESKCKSCGGNNADMPCAYPEGGQPHCLKQAEPGADELHPLHGWSDESIEQLARGLDRIGMVENGNKSAIVAAQILRRFIGKQRAAQTEVPTPKRDATGAFYGLSDEQVADVVQELVGGVRRGEVKVESLCVRFDMDNRNKRVIHIEYTACKT
jgi:hypothetical protein